MNENKQSFTLRDYKGRITYYEDGHGYWFKYEYNLNNQIIFFENSNNYWAQYEYDPIDTTKLIYYKDSIGRLINHKYD